MSFHTLGLYHGDYIFLHYFFSLRSLLLPDEKEQIFCLFHSETLLQIVLKSKLNKLAPWKPTLLSSKPWKSRVIAILFYLQAHLSLTNSHIP